MALKLCHQAVSKVGALTDDVVGRKKTRVSSDVFLRVLRPGNIAAGDRAEPCPALSNVDH
jgi:hypothetical protein